MSSYLVALIVSDFRCTTKIAPQAGPNGNLPISVCARPNVPIEHLEYSLDVGVNIIQYFQKLYNVPFPLPKCGTDNLKFYLFEQTFKSFLIKITLPYPIFPLVPWRIGELLHTG